MRFWLGQRLWMIALAGGLIGVSVSAVAGEIPTPLEGRLDAVLKADPLGSARVAALVVGEGGNSVLYAREPDRLLLPASNMKLLTALAALDALGPSHRFETLVGADRAPGAAGVVGEISVRGGGDPALNSEDWWRLAADLRREGLVRVEGDIVVDGAYFDGEYWHPAWGEVSSRAFHAPVAGLSANYGSFFVRVAPGSAEGDPLDVTLDPPLAYLVVENAGTTAGPKAQPSLRIVAGKASDARETVKVSGRLRAGDRPRNFARSVRDPVLYAGALFKLQLEALGIEVGGRVRRGAAEHPVELLRYSGRPLSEIVRLFLKYSNNAMAEGLVKALGVEAEKSPGSWSSGLNAMRSRLDALGVLGSGALIVDGSGLAAENRLSPRILVAVLARAAQSFRYGPEFVAALPIGGRDGTLEERAAAAGDGLRAKTGLLGAQRALALSGFVQRADGETVIFSLLVNGYAGDVEPAMSAVDGWVEALIQVD